MLPPERSSRLNVNPPAVPTPGMAGGEKAERDSCRQFGKLLIQMRLDGLKLLGSGSTLVPRL